MASSHLPSITTITKVGEVAEIKVEYVGELSELPNTLEAFISELHGTMYGPAVTEGDLVFVLTNYPDQIDWELNDEGELIVKSSTFDAELYSINSQSGQLEYAKQL